MVNAQDNWEKPRSKGTHLTKSEIEQIRAAFTAGRKARDIARELKCSSRVATKYYSFFAAEGEVRNKPTISLRLPKQIEGSSIAPPSLARLMGRRA